MASTQTRYGAIYLLDLSLRRSCLAARGSGTMVRLTVTPGPLFPMFGPTGLSSGMLLAPPPGFASAEELPAPVVEFAESVAVQLSPEQAKRLALVALGLVQSLVAARELGQFAADLAAGKPAAGLEVAFALVLFVLWWRARDSA